MCGTCACTCVWLLESEVSSLIVLCFIHRGRAYQLSPELSDRVCSATWLALGSPALQVLESHSGAAILPGFSMASEFVHSLSHLPSSDAYTDCHLAASTVT